MLELFRRLRLRGYLSEVLRPIFEAALHKYTTFTPDDSRSTEHTTQDLYDTSIFLHLKYHPNNPSSQTCQDVFRSFLLDPQSPYNVTDIKNQNGNTLGINRLIVAYHKPTTLGDNFSVQKLNSDVPQPEQLVTPDDSLDCG